MAKRLWAPWRFDYVKSADETNKDGCIFVDLPNETDDEKNLILHRGRYAFVMLNRYPYTSGHLMVAPYRHTADMSDLSDEELLEIQQFVRDSMEWIKIAFAPDGFNVGVNIGSAGGAGIPSHIHWHIVPRWNGDTNFMTSVGETRVIPQSMENTYQLLLNAKNQDER
ncbi:HIT domain-containing protein [Kamptonema cortianum]|nr:HIT domain-containing protein [Geitlerinema splendidum]MDK3161194.1 HIT domain-containing protein [Kamptonema cortianum]